ncbi:MAG: ATP-binding protein [Pseudomonadota bacterium]
MMKDNKAKAAWLEALLEATADSVLTTDREGIIQTANTACENLFGFSHAELIGQNVSSLIQDPWSIRPTDRIRSGENVGEEEASGIGHEVTGTKKDETTFPLQLSVGTFNVGDADFFCWIIHDLTARKTFERALKISQRLEAIGQLCGGVSHDFNNLLTVIVGNLELLDNRIEDPGERELLHEALEAAQLGADLTGGLLAFAKRGILRPEVVDVNALIQDLSGILTRTLGSQITFEIILADSLWKTRADPGQFETALLNLVLNARDAMPNGGSLIIETDSSVIDREYAAPEVQLEPGDYVRISVSDTGEGMSDETLERVFEPFFTTKKATGGTGLGLSMVYGFAKQSGGNVTIYSESGFGTTVNLYLPRHDGSAGRSDKARQDESAEAYLGSGQRVLVVEDDPRVRKLTRQRLEALNYNVISASDGVEALAVLGSNSDIDMVFTDLVMPGGVSGYEIADFVLEKHSNIPVLLTSGYAEDLVRSNELTSRSIRMLRKPYRQLELARVLHQVLTQE